MVLYAMLGIYNEVQRESSGVVCGVEEHGEEYGKEVKVLYSDNSGEYLAILFHNYDVMRA